MPAQPSCLNEQSQGYKDYEFVLKKKNQDIKWDYYFHEKFHIFIV